MRSQSDLSSSVNQSFFQNKENTMNSALCSNVGFILSRLATHFSENPLDNTINSGKSTISAEKIDKYIDALSEEMANQGMSAHGGWQYIQQKISESANELDKVTIWENGQEISLCLELKPTLALVYAALTDKEAYWKKALSHKGLTSQKEIITFRGDFEGSYPQDEADRLLTLLNCFSDLELKRVCHTGIRNDFVMTLNGVYPDVWIIENLDAFLLDGITQHLHQQIDNFKSTHELYRDILLAKMDSELLAPLKEALEHSELKFVDFIKITCAEHGINPQDLSIKVQDYLRDIHNLTLTWKGNELFSALSILLSRIPKVNDKLLTMVQGWIKDHVELDNKQHATQVISFAKAHQAFDLFKKYGALLSTWNQTVITKEEVEKLDFQLQTYEEACFDHSSPQLISEDLAHDMQLFEKACVIFVKDEQCDWIENFFIQWAMATRHDNEAMIIQLYSHLHMPEMQTKYVVKDAFLEQHLPLDVAELDITPYLINRLFLHAIMVHPKSWSKSFFDRFSMAYAFVAEKLTKEDLGRVANALKRDSYPNTLMKQLKFLQDYYYYLREDDLKAPLTDYFYIPMKHLIFTVRQLSYVTAYLSEAQKKAFIETWDNAFLKDIIKNIDELAWVFNCLSEMQNRAFMKFVGNNVLKNIIKNTNGFSRMISRISTPKLTGFMKALDNDFLKSIIKNSDGLFEVIGSLDSAQKIVFMDALDNDFLKSLGENCDGLFKVIKIFSSPQTTAFTDLDNDFLKSTIKNSDRLFKVIKYLSDAQQIAFMDAWGNDFLKSLIKGVGSFGAIIHCLSGAQKIAFIATLDYDFLKSIVNNGYGLTQVTERLSDTRKKSFIETWDNGFLKSIIKNAFDWRNIIEYLSETRITAFIKAVGNDFLKGIINNSHGLAAAIMSLPGTQLSVYIKSLGNDFLKSIINNVNELHYVIDELSKTQKIAFIEALGNDFLSAMIKCGDELRTVIWLLPETQKIAFITALDNDFLKAIIKDRNELDRVICTLPQIQQTAFKKVWDIVTDEEVNVLLDSHLEETANDMSVAKIGKPYLHTFFSQNDFTPVNEAVKTLLSRDGDGSSVNDFI